MESYRHDALETALGNAVPFCQDNESLSNTGVLRGLHFQHAPHAQSKLIRVLDGAIYDVAVDIRKGSPRYGQHVAVTLSAENKQQLFVPKGFAHGFLVLADKTRVQYKVDAYYHPESDAGIAYNDPTLAIKWPLPADAICCSTKDQQLPQLCNLTHAFTYTTPT